MRRAHSGFRDRPVIGGELPRRAFLLHTFAGIAASLTSGFLPGCSSEESGDNGGRPGNGGKGLRSNFESIGDLGSPDANGLRLAEGFSARIVARAGEAPVASSSYLWHGAPDGGATYATEDGGWVYVSNSESLGTGAGALRFDAEAKLTEAYSILQRTNVNCAGGKTPWGTWLSCEELPTGLVYECDAFGKEAAMVRPALGTFKHEAVALDPLNNHLYLTEDEPDGRFYRFVPTGLTAGGYADLSSGRLEVASVGADNIVAWKAVPNPEGGATPTRGQVAESTAFRGGEGIWYHQGVVYFTTKGDNRIWEYTVASAALRVFYDVATSATPILRGVDNVTVSPMGDVLVAEDGGDMEIVALLPSGAIKPIIQLTGQDGSEITGPALAPNGKKLYFSSQRSDASKPLESGITYEVTGPFLI